MYSEKLLKMLKGKENFYKVVWLMLPIQIIFLSLISYLVIHFGEIKPVLVGASQLQVVTIVAIGFILFPVAIGILISKSLFRLNIDFTASAKLSTANRALSEEFSVLEPVDQHVFVAHNQISTKVLIICALFEMPVMLGMVLSLLSKEANFSLAGAFVSLALWKVFIPSFYDFKKKFHQMVDSQFGQTTKN